MTSVPASPGPVGANLVYRLHVNGDEREVTDAWVGESLLYVLRERLGLMGSKGACEQGECGSCSVLIDGALVCGCLVLAASATGQTIVTIEGIAPLGSPSDVQQAFVDAGAVQCGFCTPGLIMAGLQGGLHGCRFNCHNGPWTRHASGPAACRAEGRVRRSSAVAGVARL